MDSELQAVLEEFSTFDNNVDQLLSTVRQKGLTFLKDQAEENSIFHVLGHQLQQLDLWYGSHIELIKEVVDYFRGSLNNQLSTDAITQYIARVEDNPEYTPPEVDLYDDKEILEAVSHKFQKQVKVYYCCGKIETVGSFEDEQPVLLGRLQEKRYVGLQRSYPCVKVKESVNVTSNTSDETDQSSKKLQTRCRPKSKKIKNKRGKRTTLSTKIPKETSSHKLVYARYNKKTDVIKTPGWTKSNGVLCRTSQYNVHKNIKGELSKLLKEKGPSAFMDYLNVKFNHLRKSNDDMAVAVLIQGYLSTFQLTFDMKQSHSHLKALEKSIDQYNFRHRNIIYALLYHTFFIYYAVKKKFGAADKYIQKAHDYISMECPDTWTSGIFHIRGWMYNILGYMKPKLRKMYSEEAVNLYSLARNHCLYQSCSGDTNDYYFIHYTMQMVYIRLLMPSLYTISVFPFSDVILEHGRVCEISHEAVLDVEEWISIAKLKVDNLTEKHKFKETEMILIAEIYLSIRKAQLAIASKKYNETMNYVEIGVRMHSNWCVEYKTGSSYTYLVRLKLDILKLLQEIKTKCEKLRRKTSNVKNNKEQKQSHDKQDQRNIDHKILVYERSINTSEYLEITSGILTSADETAPPVEFESDVL